MTPTGNYIGKATDVIYPVDLDIMSRDTIPEPIHLVQYDTKYQVIRVALWKGGEEYTAPANSSVNIRYLKPDHTYVYNPALGWDITLTGGSSGTTTNPDRHVVFLEVTQEMTTFPGKARFILEIVSPDGGSVIGTASLDVIIDANPVQEDGIESSSEFKTLIQYAADAEASKNAAKVSETNAAKSAQNAKTSETKAKTSETNAKTSETNAKTSETNAKASEDNALASKNAAATSAANAKTSETNAKTSETNAAASAAAAKVSEDNALASERKAKTSETNAKTSETNAANSANAASTSATNAAKSAQNAKTSETNAESYMNTAGESAADALASEQNAKRSETNAGASAADALSSKNAAKTSETKAFTSEQNAAASANAAAISEDNAEQFAQNAADSAANALASKNAAEAAQNAANTSANNAESSANAAATSTANAANSATEAEKSAQNAASSADRVEKIEQRLQGTLHAMGTIPFADLPDISEAHEGDMYNILDEFVTTEIFKDGANKKVPAGSNVYKTADGYWDVLAGTLVSSVNGQTGNVEIDLGTVDGVLPIERGGTGGTTKKAVNDIVATGSDISDPTDFAENDRFLWVYNGSSVIKSRFLTLINYIKTKLATVATSGSYNDLSNKPTTMKNPKALTFTGGVSETYDGSAAKSVAIPTTLPANGGTAETISATLPISKGGTGQTTGQAAMNALANSADIGTAMPADDDWYLAQWTGGGTSNTNVVRRKTSSLWNYIKAKCNTLYLQLSGGTMTGTIASSKTTATYLKGSQGEAIINSTASAGAYTALSKLNSTNGFFTDVIYQKSRQLIYMAKTTVDAGTNSPTKAATLLDESGNSSFPGTVTASTFKGKLTGNADTSTVTLQGKTYQVGCSDAAAPANPWYKLAECSITATHADPTCIFLIYDTFYAQSTKYWGLVKAHFRTNSPVALDTTNVDVQWIFKSDAIPANLFGVNKAAITNGVKVTLYLKEPNSNYQSWNITVLANTHRGGDNHYWTFANNYKANGDLATVDQEMSSGYGNVIASRVGTSTVGANNRPIYLNGGVPTAIGNILRLVDGTTAQNVLRLYDDGDTSNNGGNFVIQGAGNTFIGSGESPNALYTQFEAGNLKDGEGYGKTSENFYLIADTDMYLFARANTIANRVGLKLTILMQGSDNLAMLAPVSNDLAVLGYDSRRFRYVYANIVNINTIENDDKKITIVGAVAEGSSNNASGAQSHAEGSSNNATGAQSHAEGWHNYATGAQSHAEGSSNNATNFGSHAEGSSNTASGLYSHAEGYSNTATNYASHAGGKFNADMTTGGAESNTTGHAFVIGNGTVAKKSNAFSVMFTGVTKAASSITGNTTADYSEFFEWEDMNPDFEDRVGLFVTMVGEMIKIASPSDDYILGIVSGEPFLIGNADCDVWTGMYLRDEFNRTMYEPAPWIDTIEIIDEETGEIRMEKVSMKDENGNQLYKGTRPVLNPNYNPDEPYVSRSDRPEWASVGMLGVLSVKQDGTITHPNCYCTCGEGGVATLCERHAQNAYRVIKVISKDVVRVVFR